MIRLQQRAIQAESLINKLRGQLAALHDSAAVNACQAEEESLRNENNKLNTHVQQLKQRLVQAEVRNGVQQVPMPRSGGPAAAMPAVSVQPPPAVAKPDAEKPTPPKQQKKKEAKPKQQNAAAPEAAVDVSRLDFRIGKIVNVKKHPEADTLYVEEVDMGEGQNRTVVSGLVNHIPIEQMQERVAIFMCNLKPAKMRGVMSEAMIMCGSTPEKVEIIVPPADVQIGERISVAGFPGEPDAKLNPKKKIWEQVQPDLKIDGSGRATYKGVAWKVGAHPQDCTVPSLKNVIIK